MRAVEKLRTALCTVLKDFNLALPLKTVIEPPRNAQHGDLSTNVAMLVAKEVGQKPKELAEIIAQKLSTSCPEIEKAVAAGPGFCNVTFNASFWRGIVTEIEEKGDAFGSCTEGQGLKVLVEYVSANPTGPLHVGHGRGAAIGDSLTRLLRRAGYSVDTEYYINDAGRQMRLLGLSVWLRAKELCHLEVIWPEDYYHGAYIIDLARILLQQRSDLCTLPEDEGIEICMNFAMQNIMDGIKQDLLDFRVEHQCFFSEKTLQNAIDETFATLSRAGYTYEKDGAFWFATSKLGDDRDRVLKKSDGSLTYFATDIAYHHNKYLRGYAWLIDVWGADHHGYIPRMRAAIASMGKEQSSLDIVLIQLVNLLRNGEPVGMSTRAGSFETLQDVLKEVGADACRFMFLSRKSDSPLDFDLEAVKQRNLENPVYYVQYAHARIAALLRRATERGIDLAKLTDKNTLALLATEDDLTLLRKMAVFEDLICASAKNLGIHHISHYLMELAGLLHGYYTRQQVLVEDKPQLTLSRLALLRAVGQVLRNGLEILGVTAPEQM